MKIHYKKPKDNKEQEPIIKYCNDEVTAAEKDYLLLVSGEYDSLPT